MSNPAPGFKTTPRGHIATRAGVPVRVTANGEVLADTLDAIEMKEGSYPPVYYLPRGDVRMERLARTARDSYCPYKGRASYFSILGGAENAAWSYEQPYDELLEITNRLAFYPDKVDAITVA